MSRVYANRTAAIDEALELAPSMFGLPDSASTPQRLEAWIEYAVALYRREQRIQSYGELADIEEERRVVVRAATRLAIEDGLL